MYTNSYSTEHFQQLSFSVSLLFQNLSKVSILHMVFSYEIPNLFHLIFVVVVMLLRVVSTSMLMVQS